MDKDEVELFYKSRKGIFFDEGITIIGHHVEIQGNGDLYHHYIFENRHGTRKWSFLTDSKNNCIPNNDKDIDQPVKHS